METVKDILNFCNAAVLYDYENVGNIDKLYRVRKCIFNNFHQTIPVDRNLVSLSLIDVVILKIIDNDIENVIENIDDLRDNIFYTLSFEKLIRDGEGEGE